MSETKSSFSLDMALPIKITPRFIIAICLMMGALWFHRRIVHYIAEFAVPAREAINDA